MLFATGKFRMEFFKDRDDTNNSKNVILERTRQSRSGTGFRLVELYNRGLPGFFETGNIVFREV